MAPKKPPVYSYRAMFRPIHPEQAFARFDEGLKSDGRALGYTAAWHRANVDYSPYAIWNELICGELGRAIRLPIPPFAMTNTRDDKGVRWFFSSLDFNFERATLPEVIPEKCVEKMEYLSAGVLAFDIFIANEDRHEKNLLVDEVLNPKAMHVFDHDQALFGGCRTCGPARFKLLEDRLGVTGSTITGGNQQIFLPHIKTCASLMEWVKKIEEIPDYFIESTCASAVEFGLKKSEAKAAGIFLLRRKNRIRSIINDNHGAFAIGDWPRQLTLSLRYDP